MRIIHEFEVPLGYVVPAQSGLQVRPDREKGGWWRKGGRGGEGGTQRHRDRESEIQRWRRNGIMSLRFSLTNGNNFPHNFSCLLPPHTVINIDKILSDTVLIAAPS